ncbi:hypothetical protein [Klebsiella pneumoniae]|uniref:hypothetical protein n=1 Tax=Klebsiella pneumoniae TaxID=573 RepID=UPI000E2A62D0|nr:hypothetical protein [Klebsiella pneumoniae]SVS35202.1 Uncharacterised protein [Klebsiella pneumoniae]SVT29889.1 Uncharacterised protein [Klebsiella pneumoniae]
MTTVIINIETVDGVRISVERDYDGWAALSLNEKDDLVTAWVNEDAQIQQALSGSNGYTLNVQGDS